MDKMANKIVASMIPLLLVLGDGAATGSPSQCEAQSGLGWNFYCDPPRRPKEAAVPTPAEEEPVPRPVDPIEAVDAMRQALDRARADALLNPGDPDKVAIYIERQRESLERAGTFADTWRRVLWQRPELDYTLERPINNLAKTTWLDGRRAAEKQAAVDVSARYGVFFVYSSTCPYCQTFSPVLRAWSAANGITIQAVSVDGGVLPEWPETVFDQGQVAALGLSGKPVPATILYDTETNEVKPLAFGAVSAAELSERVLLLTKIGVGNDF